MRKETEKILVMNSRITLSNSIYGPATMSFGIMGAIFAAAGSFIGLVVPFIAMGIFTKKWMDEVKSAYKKTEEQYGSC